MSEEWVWELDYGIRKGKCRVERKAWIERSMGNWRILEREGEGRTEEIRRTEIEWRMEIKGIGLSEEIEGNGGIEGIKGKRDLENEEWEWRSINKRECAFRENRIIRIGSERD